MTRSPDHSFTRSLLLPALCALCALCGANLRAQTTVAVSKNRTTNAITSDLVIGAGRTLTITGSLVMDEAIFLSSLGLADPNTTGQVLGWNDTSNTFEWVTNGSGSGTVTSVDLAAPSVFSVSGNPVTTSGTLTLAWATGQTANLFLATPDGTTGAVALRAIVADDLPDLSSLYADTGAVTTSGLTMATARILGRTTASTGAIEEITIGSGLSLSAGTLSATGGSQNLFETFAVSGQSSVVADSTTDTLTLVAGTGITITTDAGTDAITITNSGGSTDATAIHDDTAGEIAAITAKATPTVSDILLIEDAAATNSKKSITIGSLEPALEGVMDLADLQGNLTLARISDAGTLAGLSSVDLTANVIGILPAANGGTGNGFTAFTGPTTSTKTFTLPDASATILTDNADVTVAQGGTGVSTLTGIVKGNGTSAFSAASAGTDYVAPGAVTSSGLTMTTARILGRTTASTGAIEEITIGTGLSLSAGELTATGGGGTPGGSDTQVQYNNAGAFGGDAGMTYNATTDTLTLAGNLIADKAQLRETQGTGSDLLELRAGSTITANRHLMFTTGDVDRNITLSGDPTLGDWFDQAVKTTSSPTFGTLNLKETSGAGSTDVMNIRVTTTLSANRILSLATGDADRTLTFSGNATLGGAITGSGHTMATARLLGRTTASTGAIEEITVGSGLSLSGGTLTATGGGSGTLNTIKEADSQVGGSDIAVLDFGAGFDLAESPDTEIQVSFDLSEVATGGDLSWSGNTPTVAADSVALTTDTTGDYVATITGDSEITVSGAGTEGRAVTLAIASSIARDSELPTQENIEDFAGAMVTGNTETLITVTYQDGDGTIDFEVDSDLANYSWTNVDATDLKVGSVTQAYDAQLDTWSGVTPGTGVTTALAATANGTGGVTTTDGTATLTNKTFDAAGTGNVLKLKSYIQLTHPHAVDGTGATINTTSTSVSYGHATFSATADEAGNYAIYRVQVPDDLDTSVAMRARLLIRATGADTGTQDFTLSMANVGDSAAGDSPTFSNAISFTKTMAAGGAGEVEQFAYATLTSWASSLTPGDMLVIKLARDGDDGTNDTSTVTSEDVDVVIEYGATQ